VAEIPEESVPFVATIYSICIRVFPGGENKKAVPLKREIVFHFEAGT